MMFQNSQEITPFNVPAVVFSGLISGLIVALVSLVSTYIQNKSSETRQLDLLNKQNEQQNSRFAHEAEQQNNRLAHEAAQKKLEREMLLRRDIYLAGIAAVGKMYDFLLSFSNINLNVENRTKILDNVGESLSKVYVIANLETLIALEKIDTYYKRNYTLLLEKRMELDNNIEFKINLENHLANALQTNRILVDEANAALKAQNKSQHDLAYSALTENQKDIQDCNKEIEQLKHTTIDQMYDLLSSCLEIISEFQNIANEVVLCVRKELNFPINEEDYKKLAHKSNNENVLHTKTFYKELIEKHRHEL